MKKTILFVAILMLNMLYAQKTNLTSIQNELKEKSNHFGFIENKGQFVNTQNQLVPSVLFKANLANFDVYITQKGISYSFFKPHKSTDSTTITFDWERIDMELIGANIKPENIIKEAPFSETYNYYFPHCSEGITNVGKYKKVIIKNIYEGIDWVIYTIEKQNKPILKYDFIVHPNADINQIKFEYKGSNKTELSEKNLQLKISAQLGNIVDGKLECFLKESNTPVAIEFTKDRTNIFSLKSKQSTFNETLIIDPVLNWATHFGGNDAETPYGITTTKDGALFVTGGVTAVSAPAMVTYDAGSGAWFQGTKTAVVNIFILKFDSKGVLLWSTYYGGSGSGEYGSSICTDSNDNIFITGDTRSANFPTFNPGGGAYYNATLTPGNSSSNFEPFILKFSSSGVRLWGSFINTGLGSQNTFRVICNKLNNHVYVASKSGTTISPQYTNPGAGAYFNTTGGALLFEFDNNSMLLWCTSIPNIDFVYDMAIDKQSNIFLTGYTSSSAIPLVNPGAGAWYEASSGSSRKLYLTKFNANRSMVWSTYYNGNSQDYGQSLTVDSCNNLYLLAGTKSTNFSTLDAGNGAYYQSTLGGLFDLFLIKFNPAGQRLWATYFGGRYDENYFFPFSNKSFSSLSNMIYDRGFLYIGGNVQKFSGAPADDIPLVDPGSGAYFRNTITTSNLSAFGLKMDVNGKLIWSSYIGSTTQQNFLVNCAADTSGQVYFVHGVYGYGSQTLDNGNPGSYYQPVKAGLNGSYTDVFIHRFNAPIRSLVVNKNNVSCNGLNDGSVSTTLSGYISPFTYTWSNGTTAPSLSAVGANTYSLTITDAACTKITTTTTITAPPPISINVAVITDASCGINNGTAQITSTVGISYNWSNATTGNTISGVAAGTYTVTATDISGCTNSSTVIINNSGSPVIQNIAVTPIGCNGSSATANVIATGGTGSLTYSWSNAATGQTAANLTSGTYTVSVTDASNCLTQSTVTINVPAVLSLSTPVITNASCNQNNGSISITASGGTGLYTYSWSNGASTITTATSSQALLSSNSYTLTVTDANNCSATTTASIGNTPGVIISSLTKVDALCNGSNGSATVNLSIGSAGIYTYSWSNGANTITTATSNQELLTSNTYTVTVNDGSCTVTSVVTITQPSAITLSNPIITNASCNQSNGSISITSSGGTGILTYSWSNGNSGLTASNLSAQTYTLTVSDANNCSTTTAASISSIGGVSISTVTKVDVLCNSGTGSATVTITPSTAPYTYSWSNGASAITSATSNQEQLTSNSYTVTVTNANNCSTTTTVQINQPALLSIATPITTDASCNQNNGSISITASGGTTPYTYSWSNGASTITTGTSNLALLSSNTYIVTVSDNNNCSTTTSTTIVNINSSVNAAVTTNITSNTISEGESIVLSAGGGTSYTWTPNNTLSCATCPVTIANPTATTTYTLIAKDNLGCADTTDITINVKKPCTGEEDVFIANVFSPNNDGKNDVLQIQGNGLTNIYFAIYDRWGNLMFESRDQAQGWDGSVNGNTVNAGTYVYYLKATCKKTLQEIILKGNVSIVK